MFLIFALSFLALALALASTTNGLTEKPIKSPAFNSTKSDKGNKVGRVIFFFFFL